MGGKAIDLALAILMVNLVGNVMSSIAIKEGHTHHVVGGDQGWDTSIDVASWSANKKFHVGDTIWFTYAAPHEGFMELKTKEEFESCKTKNPIKMYTEGLNQVSLDSEGSRFFTSTNPENCNKGLKLHVKVLPLMQQTEKTAAASYDVVETVADGPSTSHAKHYRGLSLLVWFALGFVLLV